MTHFSLTPDMPGGNPLCEKVDAEPSTNIEADVDCADCKLHLGVS